MTKYQVHFEIAYTRRVAPRGPGIRPGIRTVEACNEAEAKMKVRAQVAGSFGHWVNPLANEVINESR